MTKAHTAPTKEEKNIINIFKEFAVYEIAGYENGYNDGDYEFSEFAAVLTIDAAVSFMNEAIADANVRGYLKSPQSNKEVDPKRIRFLGNNRINHLKQVAAIMALGQFEEYMDRVNALKTEATDEQEPEVVEELAPVIEEVTQSEKYNDLRNDYKDALDYIKKLEEQIAAMEELQQSEPAKLYQIIETSGSLYNAQRRAANGDRKKLKKVDNEQSHYEDGVIETINALVKTGHLHSDMNGHIDNFLDVMCDQGKWN